MVDKVVETGVLSEIFEQRPKYVVETVGGQNVIVRLGFKRRILDVFARTGIEYVGNVVYVIIPTVAVSDTSSLRGLYVSPSKK